MRWHLVLPRASFRVVASASALLGLLVLFGCGDNESIHLVQISPYYDSLTVLSWKDTLFVEVNREQTVDGATEPVYVDSVAAGLGDTVMLCFTVEGEEYSNRPATPTTHFEWWNDTFKVRFSLYSVGPSGGDSTGAGGTVLGAVATEPNVEWCWIQASQVTAIHAPGKVVVLGTHTYH